MPEGFNVDDFLFSKLYKSVNVEGVRTINEILRALLHQRMTEESSTCTIVQILEKVHLSKKAQNFINRYGKDLEKNPLTVEFDISCGIRFLEEVFWEKYKELSRRCKSQIHALRELRNSLSHKYPLVLHDFVTHNEELKIWLEKNVDFVTLVSEIKKLEEKIGLDVAANTSEIQALIDEKKKEKYFVIELEKLRIILNDILENVSSVLKEDFTNCKKMVNENLTAISCAKVQQYDQDTYNKEVQIFKDDPMHKLITEGRKDLKNQYRCLKIANPCPWIMMDQNEKLSINNFTIEKIYTPLKIEGSRDEITTENLLVSAKMFDTKTAMSTALVLSGLPGSGKTSLCLHLLHHWTEGTNEIGMLQDYSLVIYVEVRMLREPFNIVSYLKEQRMKKSTSSIDADDLVQQLDDLKLFFIIDGYDEAKEDSKKKNVVHDIFAKFPNQRILVTTRTECQEKVKRVANKYRVPCKVLEVCGFDESKIEKFTEKVFDAVMKSESSKLSCGARTSSEFLYYVQERGKILKKHLELPLTLALMIYMWIDCPDVLNNVTTCTSLYYELFKLCQKKILSRLDSFVSDKDLEKLLILVGKKAWQLLRNEEEVLSPEDEKEIDEACKRRKVPKEELLSAFLMCESDCRSEEIKYDYSFMHRTQMEYLSAYFWAEEAGEKGLHDIINSIPSFGSHQIIIFLVGHLTRKEMLDQMLKDIFRLLEETGVEEDDYNFWWNFLTESQIDGKPSQNLAGDIVRKKLKKRNWKLTQTTVVSGLELLIATPVQLYDLAIDIEKGTDPYDVKNFLSIMQSLDRKLRGRYGKKNPIRTELHFWEHFVTKCNKPSNDLLWTLYPWGHLMDFTGSVEEYDQRFTLNFCFKVKNLRVRVETGSAQVSLSKSLAYISRSVRQLRVILALSPKECDPMSLACLTYESFKGKLELTLPHMEDEDKDWIVQVVKCVSGNHGCYKLFLEKSNLAFCTVMYIMEMLLDVVHEKYTIGTTKDPTDEQWMELEEQKKRVHVDVEWIGM